MVQCLYDAMRRLVSNPELAELSACALSNRKQMRLVAAPTLILAAGLCCSPALPRLSASPSEAAAPLDDAGAQAGVTVADAAVADASLSEPTTPLLISRDAVTPWCPQPQGWNGALCVSTTCPPPMRFRTGRGCIYEDGMPVSAFPERGNPFENQYGSPDYDQFNRSAARDALENLEISRCRADGGPDGAGHFTVTFLPTGEVGSAVIDVPFAGTSTGACITRLVRRLRLRSFRGTPVTMGQSFVLK